MGTDYDAGLSTPARLRVEHISGSQSVVLTIASEPDEVGEYEDAAIALGVEDLERLIEMLLLIVVRHRGQSVRES